jgi:RHS repeat-associated protein
MTLPSAALATAGVAAVAAVAASSVAAAPAARAAPTGNGQALVLLQNGETTAPETTALRAAGWTVVQATPAQWAADSVSTFDSYAVLVIGDPSTTSSCSTAQLTTTTLGTTWQAAVSGNVTVLGTAPAAAGTPAANSLITDAVGYAGSGLGTGLYLSLNCGYKTASAKTAVPLLNGVEGIGTAGGVTVQGGLSCTDPGMVNKWEANAVGMFPGFTSNSLSIGSWPSPGCPVQEAFNSWPAMFTPVAYDAASDVTADFAASDGAPGQPYVLLGKPASSATQALALSTGGEVPVGTTAGGGLNPAVPGATQATAGDPVNTEDGDFSQSETDVSIPQFGPALDFTRTYDSQLARQQEVAGTPGPMGYGWTDNWTPQEFSGRPFLGDIYTDVTNGSAIGIPWGVTSDPAGDMFVVGANENYVVETAAASHTQFGISMTAGDSYVVAGSASNNAGYSGDGGSATTALLDGPSGLAVDKSGDLFIADTNNNRIQEVPAASGTQFGISMTADDMYTIAGKGGPSAEGSSGDGGPATSALLSDPTSVQVDSSGDVYIADGNCRVQEVPGSTGPQRGVSMTAGDMYTIAGSPTGATCSDTGDDGPATSATFSCPYGLAVDAAGDVYVTDVCNDVVREIAGSSSTQRGQKMTANDIYTVAGNEAGGGGSSGDLGPATSADLYTPYGVTVDAAGDLYIADAGNNRIQEVAAASGPQWGQLMTTGDIYTVAGSTAGTAGYLGDGGAAASAETYSPMGLDIDPYGDLLIADSGNNVVREVFNSTNQLFGTLPQGTGITISQANGSEVTFYPKNSGGACTGPYAAAPGSGYCALPQAVDASLTYSSSGGTYTYSPSPGTSYTFSSTGALKSESDAAGDTLTLTAGSPSPGSGKCPSSASSCTTITAASGRALVLGLTSSGLVTSVTDPLGRRWTYAYDSADQLTSATDPMSNVTSYTYGAGSTGNPQLVNDLLTITSPNAQPGGPNVGKDTVNTYDSSGRVISQTDPMGYTTTFNYCVNAATGACMNPATGDGLVTVTDPDGNSTVYDYVEGTEAAKSGFTGTTLTSETDENPNTSSGTLLNTSSTDGDNNTTANTVDGLGNITTTVAPASTGTATTTTGYAESVIATEQLPDCTTTAQATSACSADSPPSPVVTGGVITPPSSAPPEGATYILYDADGNELYSTTGVYEPGSNSAAYSKTTYQLFNGNSVTLPGTSTAITCTATAPSRSLPCAKINADGVVTQLAYDSAGDLVSSSTPDGNGSEVAVTTYAYDGDGEQTSTTLPDGNLSGANVGNYTTVTAYNNDGEKTSVTQADGTGATVAARATTYGYDANGNQTTVKDARGYTTTTAFNPDNQASLVTNPDADSTLTCYDGDGNTAQTVPAVGVAAGNLTMASCPSSYPAGYGTRLAADATVTTYNANGEKAQEAAPAPAGQSGYETTTYAYDGDGNQIQVTALPTTNGGSPLVTVDTYTPGGQVAAETTASGTSTASLVSYCYDPEGDKTSAIYADGNSAGLGQCETSSPWVVSASVYASQAKSQTTYGYDSLGEQVSTTTPATTAAPNGATTTTTYDPAGNVLTSTDPDGVTTTYTYTPGNQQASISYSGSSAHSVGYAYDADGNKTRMTDGTGTSSYAYDPFSELTSATNGAGQAVAYSYDADGDVATIGYPLPASATWAASRSVTYGYDNADLLASATDFNSKQLIITRTAEGRPASISLGSTGDTLSTTYDQAGNASQTSLTHASNSLESFSYGYSPANTILTETDSPSSPQSPATYSYDTQGRVTSMTPDTSSALTYAYDPSGDLTTLPTGATGSYDHAGELTSGTLSGSTTSYAYNGDGERLTAAEGQTTLATGSWNGASELASYSDTAAQMSTAAYDGNGLRAATTITPSGGSATSESYVWDISQQAPQLLMDSANAYIYDDSGAPAEQVNLSTGAVTYLVTDALGSVRGTVSSTGSLTGTASYDAWGNPSAAGGLTATTPFGFAGGYTDATGLIYLDHRYYDPQTGQFTSVDPLLSQTLLPYAYANGDPVSQVDPTGSSSLWEGYTYTRWNQSPLQACIGVDEVVAAQICATFSVGGAIAGYWWLQYNSGRSDVTVTAWMAGYNGAWIYAPQYAMSLWYNGRQVFRQASQRGNGYYNNFWSANPVYTDDAGNANVPSPAVPQGSTIDYDLWVAGDYDVRGDVKEAHTYQHLVRH